MNAGNLLGVLGGLLGLVLVVATVVAYFRASLAKATIETLKDSNSALTDRVAILEAEQERQKVRTESLERENATLREAVSGKADVAEILALITHHHNEVTAARHESDARMTAAFVEMHHRFDSDRRKLVDILQLLGDKRYAEPEGAAG